MIVERDRQLSRPNPLPLRCACPHRPPGRDALILAPWVACAPAAVVAIAVLGCSLLADAFEQAIAGKRMLPQ